MWKAVCFLSFFPKKTKFGEYNFKRAVSNAKIRAFEAAFFLFFCLGEKKIPLGDKKEHD